MLDGLGDLCMKSLVVILYYCGLRIAEVTGDKGRRAREGHPEDRGEVRGYHALHSTGSEQLGDTEVQALSSQEAL